MLPSKNANEKLREGANFDSLGRDWNLAQHSGLQKRAVGSNQAKSNNNSDQVCLGKSDEGKPGWVIRNLTHNQRHHGSHIGTKRFELIASPT